MSAQTKVIIVHGTGGSPSDNWFPWLQRALVSMGHDVSVPHFPTPEGQSFEAWRSVFDEVNDQPPERTILVGHSMGCGFILRMAESTKTPYRGLFAVSPFVSVLGNKWFDDLNASFVDHVFDWSHIQSGAEHRVCFAGDDDPYVPLPLPVDVAEKMAAQICVIENGGHLNAERGLFSFPQLLDSIKTVL